MMAEDSSCGSSFVFPAVFRRSGSLEFLKLTHKMDFAGISAEGSQGANAHVTVCQIIFCKVKTRMDNI